MKNALQSLASTLLVLFFTLNYYHSEAQMRIVNNTNCDMLVVTAQDDGTCSGCNISATTFVAANGGTYVHPYDPTCGPEKWLGVKYQQVVYVAPSAPVTGEIFNPAAPCGPTVAGTCNGGLVTANWFSGGALGPVTVILQ